MLSALAWSARGDAQAIDVTGDDGCVTEAGLRAAMRRYAARVAPEPLLRVAVRPGEATLSFELVRDGRVIAERTFEALPPRCTERVRVVAIAIALAFESVQAQREAGGDSSRTAAAASTEPAPAQRSEQQAVKPPVDGPPSTPEPAPEEARQPAAHADGDAAPEREVAAVEPEASDASGAPIVTLQAGGGVLLGVLPEAAPALALGAGFALDASALWQLELVGLASPGVTTELADGVVDAQLYGGQASVCAVMALGVLRASGCAGLAAAAVPARGRDFAVSARSTLTGWTAVLLAGALDLPIAEPVSLRIYAGLYGSVIRPTLEVRVDDERRDATSFPIGSVLSAHVLWTLP